MRIEIAENLEFWSSTYQKGWLAQYHQGTIDWDIYDYIKNEKTPGTPGIDLTKSRLIFITSAGSYIKDQQEPYKAEDPLGDYSIRLYPKTISLDELAVAHDHYDHAFVSQDPQVLLPLEHLHQFAEEGTIGELAPTVISLMGYQPDVSRVVEETIPDVISAVKKIKADAAFLVPS